MCIADKGGETVAKDDVLRDDREKQPQRES